MSLVTAERYDSWSAEQCADTDFDLRLEGRRVVPAARPTSVESRTTSGHFCRHDVRMGGLWLRGDCHVHSARSHGGELTPQQIATEARAAGLDFIAITEHNTADTNGVWDSFTSNDLLVVLGQEVTTDTGHWLALGLAPGQTVEWRYGLRDDVIDQHRRSVQAGGGISGAAHPMRTIRAAPSWTRSPVSTRRRSGTGRGTRMCRGRPTTRPPWPSGAASRRHPRRAVAPGDRQQRRPPGRPDRGNAHCGVGRSENHRGDPGRRSGRSELDRRGRPRSTSRSRPPPAGAPPAWVSFHTEDGRAYQESLPSHGSGVVLWSTRAAESGFVRAEVRQPDGQLAALTNPVILGPWLTEWPGPTISWRSCGSGTPN